ncbi:uncharacterized protein LOC130642315 [Hydractinia symbiolongicarpus]|uniref:uncharacterized protein LOC130642315 n=1 Tax=Hydractinia symbiolongicarpus TaxID=13093 RepID=UPI00254CEFDF|nr:uncharacterized protein LOC130642315 [Hydractinia symbiolongicarpus]
MLAGINYMHHEGVAHMDLKEANIIINEQLQVKIIDFGLSIQALRPGFHRPRYDAFGTSLYMSPELHFRRGYYGREADMWAFGVLLYRSFTGSFPFKLNGKGRLIPPNRFRCRPIGRPCSYSK